jgi:hypothetical protein
MFCTKLTLVVIFLGCSSHFDIARGSFGYVKSDRGSMVCFRERIASESLVVFRLNSCDAVLEAVCSVVGMSFLVCMRGCCGVTVRTVFSFQLCVCIFLIML